jgi:Fe-S-cluster containining protein
MEGMSLGCARCGTCCDPVIMDFGTWSEAVEDARRYGPGEVTPPGQWANRVFVAANLRPVGAGGGKVDLACRFYDRAHMACRAYDQRPPMCSGYPWYGRDPEPSNAPLCCSYLLDVAPSERPAGSWPLIPLTVI